MDKQFHPTLYWACDCKYMLGFKLNHVIKREPWWNYVKISRCCSVQSQHDDVIKWKHIPRYWPFVHGIHRSPVNSQHKGQWREALIFSLICVCINDWVNNHEADGLRRHHAHYDVIVMRFVKAITADNLVYKIYLRVVIMPTLLSLVAPQVVMTTTCGATTDNKVAIMTTLGFHRLNFGGDYKTITSGINVYES